MVVKFLLSACQFNTVGLPRLQPHFTGLAYGKSSSAKWSGISASLCFDRVEALDELKLLIWPHKGDNLCRFITGAIRLQTKGFKK